MFKCCQLHSSLGAIVEAILDQLKSQVINDLVLFEYVLDKAALVSIKHLITLVDILIIRYGTEAIAVTILVTIFNLAVLHAIIDWVNQYIKIYQYVGNI